MKCDVYEHHISDATINYPLCLHLGHSNMNSIDLRHSFIGLGVYLVLCLSLSWTSVLISAGAPFTRILQCKGIKWPRGNQNNQAI